MICIIKCFCVAVKFCGVISRAVLDLELGVGVGFVYCVSYLSLSVASSTPSLSVNDAHMQNCVAFFTFMLLKLIY